MLQASLPLTRGMLVGGGRFHEGIWLTQRVTFKVWEEEPCGRCGEG